MENTNVHNLVTFWVKRALPLMIAIQLYQNSEEVSGETDFS